MVVGADQTRWPDDAKETAREVWGFLAGQNVAKACVILQDQYELTIPYRTVADWVERYQWQDRLVADVKAIAPAIRDNTVIELIFGAYEGAKMLRNQLTQEKPDKTHTASAIALLDRAGFSPLNRAPAPDMSKGTNDTDHLDIAALDPGAIRDAESSLLDQLKQARVKRSADGTSR